MSKIEEEKISRATPSWIGMYSGLITVLLCFFVFMLAESGDNQTDRTGTNQEVTYSSNIGNVSNAGNASNMEDSGNVEITNATLNSEKLDNIDAQDDSDKNEMSGMNSIDYSSLANEIRQKLEDKGTTIEDTELTIASDGLLIRLPSVFLFDSGKAILRKEAATKIDSIASVISESFGDLDVLIEGHTDNVPIKSNQFPSNWELSSARAIAIATYFVDVYHVDSSKVVAIGYGDNRPIASNDTVEGRVQNRRVEIKLISKNK